MTKHKLNKIAQSLHKNSPIQKDSLTQKKIQPNYYLSVASVENSMIESTCIFPEILNKRINACVENTNKQKLNS